MISGVSLEGVHPNVRDMLGGFASLLKENVIVTSAYRPQDVGEHSKGLAIDIVVPAYAGRLLDLYLAAEKYGWNGIGIYPSWQANGKVVGGLHLDMRLAKAARWMGLGSGKQQQYVALNQENLKKHRVI